MIDRKHTPVPLIEEHYHIKSLIENQQKRSEDRTHSQNVEKDRDGQLKNIQGYAEIETLDFWCDQCKVDFVARAKKQIDSWDTVAYYKTKHPCGKWCIRHITDRLRDAYFFKSKKVAHDRAEKSNDALQPFETGFNTLYGKK